MSFFSALRQLRHGPLRDLSFLWKPLGCGYRAVASLLPIGGVAHRIGRYGPFQLDPFFAFSDFEHWGSGHNNGFTATVEACRNKNCVFDVGGHIGLVSLPVSRVIAPMGLVCTFEPATSNLRYLRRHLALNGISNVQIVEALVGATDGEADFFEQEKPTGQNSVVVKKYRKKYRLTKKRQITLDSFVQTHRLAPEIIKIDVEGAEVLVLEGARKTLTRHRPVLFLSVHPKELELLGSSTADLVALFQECDYVCTEIDGSPLNGFRLAEYRVSPKELAYNNA